MKTQPRMPGGRHELIEPVGRGGMADVFEGTESLLGRPIAVKVLARPYSSDPGFVERFRREARAAARLNHGVVAIFDTGSDSGIHHIVMEPPPGRTLAELLAWRKRPGSHRAESATRSAPATASPMPHPPRRW